MRWQAARCSACSASRSRPFNPESSSDARTARYLQSRLGTALGVCLMARCGPSSTGQAGAGEAGVSIPMLVTRPRTRLSSAASASTRPPPNGLLSPVARSHRSGFSQSQRRPSGRASSTRTATAGFFLPKLAFRSSRSALCTMTSGSSGTGPDPTGRYRSAFRSSHWHWVWRRTSVYGGSRVRFWSTACGGSVGDGVKGLGFASPVAMTSAWVRSRGARSAGGGGRRWDLRPKYGSGVW